MSLNKIVKLRQITLGCAAALALAGCTPPDGSGGVNDPFEASNRKNHEFNKSVDRALLRPASNTYGQVVPDPLRQGVSNFAGNVGLPGAIVNNVLQGDIGGAANNTLRFVVNSTLGLGGLFDPSTGLGLEEVEADFGSTLAAWGVGEGAYMELPFLGPSTERDAVGTLLDIVLDPLGHAIGAPEQSYLQAAKLGGGLNSRYTYSDTVDSVLYDSADSYAQSRLIYLQNRRFELGADVEDDYYDPYEDPYDF